MKTELQFNVHKAYDRINPQHQERAAALEKKLDQLLEKGRAFGLEEGAVQFDQ